MESEDSQERSERSSSMPGHCRGVGRISAGGMPMEKRSWSTMMITLGISCIHA